MLLIISKFSLNLLIFELVYFFNKLILIFILIKVQVDINSFDIVNMIFILKINLILFFNFIFLKYHL
jgi:hypothetical protein